MIQIAAITIEEIVAFAKTFYVIGYILIYFPGGISEIACPPFGGS